MTTGETKQNMPEQPSQTATASQSAPTFETNTNTGGTQLKAEFDPVQIAKLAQENKMLQEQIAKFESEKAVAIERERKSALEQIAAKDGAAKAIEEQFRVFKEEQENNKVKMEEILRKAQEESTAKWKTEAERADKIEQVYLSEKKENVINRAIDGKEFVSAAAERQVRKLLEDRFDVSRDDKGSVTVRDRVNGKYASDVIPELLATEDFEHFLKPSTRGGAGVSNNGAGREPSNSASYAKDDPLASLWEAARESMNRTDSAIGFGFRPKAN